ncbi:MAG: hypothetical protein KGL34_12195 [Gammaproteobacteria bacterium]|nr:hypothetical protein [Gammaproteobacteria bacterium]
MSEVDRLSNSGLYPALPIAERRSRREEHPPSSQGEANHHERPGPAAGAEPADTSETARHRIPKSLIDEYA